MFICDDNLNSLKWLNYDYSYASFFVFVHLSQIYSQRPKPNIIIDKI